MKKILLYNYSLSVFLARGKTYVYKRGTWFLTTTELFLVLLALEGFFITKLKHLPSNTIQLFIYVITWLFCYYGIKKPLMGKVDEIIAEKNNTKINGWNTIIGLLLFVGSFVLFTVTMILSF